MRKLASFNSTVLTALEISVTRIANVYESEDSEFKGKSYEVSTHNGGAGADWEFKPFDNTTDAVMYALQYVAKLAVVFEVVE